MKIGIAVAIFKSIEEAKYSTEDKAIAIKRVLEMPTHNSITKQEMLNVIEWLLDQAFEFET